MLFGQQRADQLLADGAAKACADARAWIEINLLALVGRRVALASAWRISRLDLAADVAGDLLRAGDVQRLTTRAKARVWRETRTRQHVRELTSLVVGTRSAAAHARLYDKTRQAAADAPIRECWTKRGYEAETHGTKVWRVEFAVG